LLLEEQLCVSFCVKIMTSLFYILILGILCLYVYIYYQDISLFFSLSFFLFFRLINRILNKSFIKKKLFGRLYREILSFVVIILDRTKKTVAI